MTRILVIDQDASIRNLLQEVLEEEGYRVVEAHNGYEGLQGAPAALPAGTISDVLYLVAF